MTITSANEDMQIKLTGNKDDNTKKVDPEESFVTYQDYLSHQKQVQDLRKNPNKFKMNMMKEKYDRKIADLKYK